MIRRPTLAPSASAAFGLAGLLLVVPLAAFAVAGPGSSQEPAAAAAPEDDEEKTALEECMDTLKQGMRHLRRNVTNPDALAENLEVVRGMQKASLTAVWHCPEPFEELGAERAVAWEVGFKRKQLDVADRLMQMELALAEGRVDDARALYGELRDLKSEGHDTYDPEE